MSHRNPPPPSVLRRMGQRKLTDDDIERIRQALDEAAPTRLEPGFAPLSDRYRADPGALARAVPRTLDGQPVLSLVKLREES